MTHGLEDEMLPILVKTFPKAFFLPGRSCIPLRVGICKALDAALPPEIDRPRLKLYLGIYTMQPRYLRELTLGATRIDLFGRPAGRVSTKEAASATARLQEPQGPESGSPMARAAGAQSAASIAVIPAPQASKLGRRLDSAGFAGAACRRNAVQAKTQKVLVVVKKKRGSLTDARQIDASF